MACNSFCFVLALSCAFHLVITSCLVEATSESFTLDLVHRDSPLSPYYNPSQSHFDRLRNAFHRSLSRINHLKPVLDSQSDVQTKIVPGGGEYLMDISIGTPPFKVLGIADTGSDLTWTQCKPCKECYSQALPLFDPANSSSYHDVSCDSDICSALEKSTCGVSRNTCQYSYSYGDGSFTNGNLFDDTITVGSDNTTHVSIPNIVFGCGHDNGGTFNSAGSGIIGLGGGELSLVSQLSQSTGKKFSYCLIPTSENDDVSSKIKFGRDAEVLGSKVVTTPLVSKDPDTFYYLTLEAITIGETKIETPKSLHSSESVSVVEEGNIIIDSGTTLSFIPADLYNDMVAALEKSIPVERAKDPNGNLSPCYKSKSDDIGIPDIIAHFKDADLKLLPVNTFARVSDDLMCFTMVSVTDGISIFGNLAQMNFLIEYDLEARTVSFLPADCTKK